MHPCFGGTVLSPVSGAKNQPAPARIFLGRTRNVGKVKKLSLDFTFNFLIFQLFRFLDWGADSEKVKKFIFLQTSNFLTFPKSAPDFEKVKKLLVCGNVNFLAFSKSEGADSEKVTKLFLQVTEPVQPSPVIVPSISRSRAESAL